RAFTRPWYRYGPRSKRTLVMPACRARAAISSPTRAATSVFLRPAIRPRTSLSSDDAADNVRPAWSSINWQSVFVLLRNTDSRGRAVSPRTRLRTRHALRSRFFARNFATSAMSVSPRGHSAHADPNALPALRLMTSFSYLKPLPLYGSGGFSFRICAANWPTCCRSAPRTIRLVGLGTSTVTVGGTGTLTGLA